jgi:hypothetical protein
MPPSLPTATLMISVAADEGLPPDSRPLDEAVSALAQRLVDQNLAATWTSRAPADWRHTAQLAREPRQEIAVTIGRRGVAADDCPFTSGSEEVRRQILRSRAAGVDVSTLFFSDSTSCERHDLLAKYGITAICAIESRRLASPPKSGLGRLLLPFTTESLASAQKLRFGLWKMPTAIDLALLGARRTRRAVDRAMSGAAMTPLHFDLPAVLSRGATSFEAIDSLLRHVTRQVQSGRLVTQTMKEAAACLSRTRRGVSACSILRKQAA